MSDTSSVLDRAELAWAAGFFDGEGSTIAHALSARPGYFQLNVTVPQACHEGVPPLLQRFQRLMLGMGQISGPDRDDLYMLRFNAREEANLVLQLMWPELGAAKRIQAERASEIVEQHHAAAGHRMRKPRKSAPAVPSMTERTSEEIERAWAAGFLDAEGCFGLNRGRPRVRGAVWYRIRVSANQHGIVGSVPPVLQRLQRALAGIGRIDRHGSADDYKWSAEGRTVVEHVLATTAPWLGAQKRAQADRALRMFSAQTRLKGDATHCVRGHPYSHLAIKDGRVRRICNACERISDRARRAAQGIAPRRFKDLARRYT